jgi:hypothetical protein
MTDTSPTATVKSSSSSLPPNPPPLPAPLTDSNASKENNANIDTNVAMEAIVIMTKFVL